MENYIIITFKNDLKEFQINRKQILKKCDEEIALLKKIVNGDPSIYRELIYGELTADNIIKRLPIFGKYCSIETFEKLLTNSNNKRKKKKKKDDNYIEEAYKNFTMLIEGTKKEHIKTQNIINAFDNDKIKNPINNIQDLIQQIKYTNLSIPEISKIIGMTISFNSQYAKKNKNHQILNVDIIDKLAKYYNPDGTFKYNEDIDTFEKLMEQLFDGIEKDIYMLDILNVFSIQDISTLLSFNNEQLNEIEPSSENNTITETIYQTHSIPKEQRQNAFQKVKKYYKDGNIIKIPENLDEFYKILENAGFDEKERIYIIKLIKYKIENLKNITFLSQKFLNNQEQSTYEKSSNLLNTLNNKNGDFYVLKQYLEELQATLQLLETETDEDDKKYLLNEVQTIIEELSIICNKYEPEEKYISSNKLIFLLNKEGIPYIYEDIDNIDSNYKKSIYSLINKISPDTASQFKKILHREPLPYPMHEIKSPRGHVAFIEIDTETYLIIGANIPRNGYKELVYRLQSNVEIIKEIEDTIKNAEKRNNLLTTNEEYLQLFSSNENSTNYSRKLTPKNISNLS